MRKTTPPPAGPPRRRLGRWLVLLGLTPAILLALEFILRLSGFGYPTAFFLPVQLRGTNFLVENPDFGRRYFPPGLERAPSPLLVQNPKPPNTRRIVILGESAALGDPEPAVGFARILEVLLQAALTNQHVEVINTAMTAINSHVARDQAEACAALDADFWIVYLGHNEVVGPFGAGTVFGPPAPPRSLVRAQLALKSTRLGQLLDALYWRLLPAPDQPSTWNGPAMFLRHTVPADDPRLDRVRRHFAENLRAIIATGTRSGARVIVSTVAANLRDCAPFASAHRPGLAPTELATWESHYQAGVNAWRSNQLAIAATQLTQALAIDDHHAGLRYVLGQTALAQGLTNDARKHLPSALALDTLRFRGDDPINRLIREAAAQHPNVQLLDLAQALADRSPGGLPGAEWFYEHVHFNFDGNYAVAVLLARTILGAKAPAQLLPPDACAEQLGFTAFDRYRVLDEVRQRLEQPPFNQQLDHEAQLRRLHTQMAPLKSGNFSDARALYEKAIARRPDDWVLRENFGTLLNDFQQFTDAMPHWQKMIELRPHAVDGHLGLADAWAGLGSTDQAVAWVRRALRLQPNAAATRHVLGQLLARAGQETAARQEFQRALRLDPRLVDARLDLAESLARQGRRPEALEQLAEILRQQPDHTQARQRLEQWQRSGPR